jgi:hypothetical protein
LRHPIRSRFSRTHGRPHVLIVDQLVPRLLQDIEVKHGSIGYMVAFQGLRPTTRGRFSETYVDKCTGYNGVDAYHNVSEERWGRWKDMMDVVLG